MKRSFTGIISLLCLFIALTAVIYSCRKQELDGDAATDRLVENAIDWHDSHISTTSTLSNKKKAKKLRPDWDNAYVEKNERGTRFLVVPASDYAIKNKDVRGFRRFVFTEKNGEITGGEIVEFFGNPSFISSHKKDLPARKDDQEIKGYDGVVIHYDVNYRYRGGSMFKNGKKQKGAVQIRSGSQVTLKKMAKGNKTADYTDPQPGCEYYFLVWYDTYTYEIIDWIYLGEWCPDDGDNPYGNEGGGGGGDMCSSCPIPPDPKDPCVEKNAVSNRAPNNNSHISDLRSIVETATTEWGANQRVDGWPNPSSYMSENISNQGMATSWGPDFKWNATDGYQIGASHLHPGYEAPSPNDVTIALSFLQHSDLQAAGSAAIGYFQKNWSVTTVSKGATYVITIKDWNALNNLASSITNPVATYQAIAASYGNSSERALLEMYGSAINLYRAPINSTSFQPLEIKTGSSSTYVAPKNCP